MFSPGTIIRGNTLTDSYNLIYNPLTQTQIDFLKNNINSIYNTYTNLSNNFIKTVNGIFDSFNGNSSMLRAKNILNKYAYLHNNICSLTEDNIRQANLIMQKYILAELTLNSLYKNNKCYGFSDSYVDMEPNSVGEERYDYQRVVDGLLQFEEDEDIGYITYYSNADTEDELTSLDKIMILDTWNVVKNLIAKGIDPSNPNTENNNL